MGRGAAPPPLDVEVVRQTIVVRADGALIRRECRMSAFSGESAIFSGMVAIRHGGTVRRLAPGRVAYAVSTGRWPPKGVQVRLKTGDSDYQLSNLEVVPALQHRPHARGGRSSALTKRQAADRELLRAMVEHPDATAMCFQPLHKSWGFRDALLIAIAILITVVSSGVRSKPISNTASASGSGGGGLTVSFARLVIWRTYALGVLVMIVGSFCEVARSSVASGSLVSALSGAIVSRHDAGPVLCQNLGVSEVSTGPLLYTPLKTGQDRTGPALYAHCEAEGGLGRKATFSTGPALCRPKKKPQLSRRGSSSQKDDHSSAGRYSRVYAERPIRNLLRFVACCGRGS